MQPLNNEEMTLAHRLMAMGIGGVSSVFALFMSEPKTRREAIIRFIAGCVVAFAFTGITLQLLHISINTDSVLATGLVWGSVGWWTLGGIVKWGQEGGPLAFLARLVQGNKDKSNGEDKP